MDKTKIDGGSIILDSSVYDMDYVFSYMCSGDKNGMYF